MALLTEKVNYQRVNQDEQGQIDHDRMPPPLYQISRKSSRPLIILCIALAICLMAVSTKYAILTCRGSFENGFDTDFGMSQQYIP